MLPPQSGLMMIRIFMLAILGASLFPARASDAAPSSFPWPDGESLTYLVSWGSFQAAEGTFVARNKGDHWDFNLELSARGLVGDFYPFNDYFWCVADTAPWRSTEYGEFRF